MKSVSLKVLFLLLFSVFSFVFGQTFTTPDEALALDENKVNKEIVHDFGNLFSFSEKQALEQKLVAFSDSTSTQIAVVTFNKLDGYPLELLASEIGEKWGVGQKGKDNGIVILLSDKDRKVTIRTGYGAQIHVPPTISNNIIQTDMIPNFRNGNYYQGVDAAINSLQKAFSGKYKADPKAESGGISILGIFFIVFFLLIIFSFFFGNDDDGRGNNGGGRKRSLLDDVILMNTGSTIFRSGGFGGSSGGGSFGGGGFGGFGGGSFGGGGSSGSW